LDDEQERWSRLLVLDDEEQLASATERIFSEVERLRLALGMHAMSHSVG
jgi:hypothetical protein